MHFKRLGVEVRPNAKGWYPGIANIGDEPDCVGDLIESYEYMPRVPFLRSHASAEPALGDAYPSAVGRRLHVEIALAPAGTSVAVDEARRTIEAGIAELSIGFTPREEGRRNVHGGVTWPRVRVNEISLVGAGCSVGSGVPGGKLLQAERRCACAAEPRTYRVPPELVAKAAAEVIPALLRDEYRKALCAAGGRLGDTDEDLAAVLAKMRSHGAPGAGAVLRKMLSTGPSTPETRALAPSLGERFAGARRELAPAPAAPLLEIPARFLKAARA
jgi:hypothetical protein